MKITVILCTYNRCERLAKALSGAAALTLPDSVDWEVLVVDNNSSDRTGDVVEEFSRRHPGRFRYLFEPQPGKSHALNSGIQEARGEILAFMDDDVMVEPTWLRNLTAGVQSTSWAGAGGRILPDWTSSPPSWLPTEGRLALAPLAAFDLGPEARQLTEAPIGANMAFRREMFVRYGLFRTDLGPRPGSEIRSEDAEFGARLLAAGERIRYEPSAVVHHPVPENRLTRAYFQAWWFDKGRTNIRQSGIPADVPCCRGIPVCLLRHVAVWALRWVIATNPRRRFERKLTLWERAGELVESHRQWLDARAKRASLVSPARRWGV